MFPVLYVCAQKISRGGRYGTVYPLAAEDVNDGELYDQPRDVYENHMHSIHGPRNSVMLIRLRSADAAVVEREGQVPLWRLLCVLKICTHIGLTSLYEAQTNRILCPCISRSSMPCVQRHIFGPAARALPQLPAGW